MKDVQTQLRWPVAIRAQITAAAQANRRSMNAEIVARLEASLRADAQGQEERAA